MLKSFSAGFCHFYCFLSCDAVHSADCAVARCPSICLSVCHNPLFYKNSSTYHWNAFTAW